MEPDETLAALQYFSALGVHKRGPQTRLQDGPRSLIGITWAEWFKRKWGEDYFRYVERAKAEGLGDKARAHARKLGEREAVQDLRKQV